MGTEGDVRTEEASLFAEIPKRRTYRKRFGPQAISNETLSQLSEAAQEESAWLEFVTTAENRALVADLVTKGAAVQWANPRWRRELAVWMHSKRKKDGLTLPGLVAPVARIVVRTFNMGNGVGAKDKQLAEESPVLAVLATRHDTTDAWMHAGQALERVLLTARKEGLQASYLNQPMQVDSLRPELRDLLANPGVPQVLLRLGQPEENIPATPRRDVRDVLEAV
jgi:hypothetical protein